MFGRVILAAVWAATEVRRTNAKNEPGSAVATSEQQFADDPDHAYFNDIPGPGARVPAMSHETLHALHVRLDSNGDGLVHHDEVMAHHHEYQFLLALKEADLLLEDRKLDLNQDGLLSFEEHMTGEEGHINSQRTEKDRALRKQVEADKFLAADKDGNGQLNTTERTYLWFPDSDMEGVMTVEVRYYLGLHDKDDNGKLTRAEYYNDKSLSCEPGQDDAFAFSDADNDCSLNMAEIAHLLADHRPADEQLRHLTHHADEDKDGHFSVEEFVAARHALLESEAHQHLESWRLHHEL